MSNIGFNWKKIAFFCFFFSALCAILQALRGAWLFQICAWCCLKVLSISDQNISSRFSKFHAQFSLQKCVFAQKSRFSRFWRAHFRSECGARNTKFAQRMRPSCIYPPAKFQVSRSWPSIGCPFHNFFSGALSGYRGCYQGSPAPMGGRGVFQLARGIAWGCYLSCFKISSVDSSIIIVIFPYKKAF